MILLLTGLPGMESSICTRKPLVLMDGMGRLN